MGDFLMNTSEPKWEALVASGGDSAWEDDRQRKFLRIRVEAEELLQIADRLAAEGALHRCSADVLSRHPKAAYWYVSLACYAQKTLRSINNRAAPYGLKVSPDVFLKKMGSSPNSVSRADLDAFSDWVNVEIQGLLPRPLSDVRLYALHVAMIVGGRIIGQGQNEGGGLAVAILKDALLRAFPSDPVWEFLDSSGRLLGTDAASCITGSVWRFTRTSAELDFRGGGNRPDLRVSLKGRVRLVAEIKGRKDLSNKWESWMPQLADHLLTWSSEFPDALRGVFMTEITKDMIDGVSRSGTRRTGLRQLHRDQRLQFAFNLTKLAEPKLDQEFLDIMSSCLGISTR